MRRLCMTYLKEWLASSTRKPLIIRGARQVGKTWIVGQLAKETGKKLISFNFEKTPALASLFESNDPHHILRKIEERFSLTIDPTSSILFLDEIQAEPELIAKLRWFYEDMPELPVIAAGSLLEFVLGTYPMSMPVGRVSFMYIEPLSFVEFLMALNKDKLLEVIQHFYWGTEINKEVHGELSRLFRHYVYIGGLPEAVKTWLDNQSLTRVNEIHRELLSTYRGDFGKYDKNVSSRTLNAILDTIPHSLGEKLVFSKLDPSVSIEKNKLGLKLLSHAKVVHLIAATAANGLPLKGEVNPKFMKAILLDVGLCSAELGLTLDQLEDLDELVMVNKGGIAEQIAGQLLRTISPFYYEPALYYWLRHKRGSDAEIDYVIPHRGRVVPIEVKAGSVGQLKSLHLFMKLKTFGTAVRLYGGLPLIDPIKVKDREVGTIQYELRSIPFYMISELPRLLD